MAESALFICHAPADAAFARDLGLALETSRFSVWRDTRNARGGDRPVSEVRWAIEQARQVLVVISLNTGDSAWLRREIEIAQDTERRRADHYRVIPLLLPGVDNSVLAQWFTPLPRTTPITLGTDGLGAALPALLKALGGMLPGSDPERTATPPAHLELHLETAPADAAQPWRLRAQFQPVDPAAAPLTSECLLGPLSSPAPEIVHWYLHSHPRWPTDTLRQFARNSDTLLAHWGQRLHRATLAAPPLRDLVAAWRQDGAGRECSLSLRAAVDDPAAALLDLPWELLHDGSAFLLQSKQPVQIQRRLSGGGTGVMPAAVPLRILAISPRPDAEPTGHPDYRRSALPLLDAVDRLGDLLDLEVLNPPTLTTLEQCLNEAWASGRPFSVLHLDGYCHASTSEGATFAFESSYDLHAPLCRDAHFVPFSALATLLATYRIRLVSLVAGQDGADATAPHALAELLLRAGIASVMVLHPDTPAHTLSRFWTAFCEELLRGARLSQALFAGQRRLAGDSYRAPGLGGGGVHLLDWFAFRLYRGEHDPRLLLRPPLELWRRLQARPPLTPLANLPVPANCFGRGRELLLIERLFENQAAVFLRGPGSIGKTTTVAALVDWLRRCGRYRHVACVRGGDISEVRALLDTLGQQLLPEGNRWSVSRYPTQWQAQEYLRQTLREQPVLIILDQMERWPSENDEAFDQFWRELLHALPGLRLLGMGRCGPPFFAQPWLETMLAPLDEEDALALLSQALISAGEMPPAADSGRNTAELFRIATLAGGSPGALVRLAHEISVSGIAGTLERLRPLRAELLRMHEDDPQWPHYLGLELAVQRLPLDDRQQLPILAFFREGANRLALGRALDLDTQAVQALGERLVTLQLAEDRGHGHLWIDPALSQHLSSHLNGTQRTTWRARWRSGMEYLLQMLYQQYFKDNTRTLRLLRLELGNLLALLRDSQHQSEPERTAQLASRLEQLFANLGTPKALAEVTAARERAGLALQGWSRARFDTERLRIERLRDESALDEALRAARHLLRQTQDAGPEAYPGAPYDLAHAHFLLGKLLKQANAAEAAVRELSEARQRFQTLASAGNTSAGRMAAVADAENGDCLTYLRRLQEAAAAYEAALEHAGANQHSPTVATHRMQLGLVRQRQGHYAAAATLYEAARQTFELLGDPENTAQAWRQLGMARKLDGQLLPALQACQQALYLYERQRNRPGIAETLGELGHLHQTLNQLEEAVLAYRRMAELYAQLGDGRGEEASRNKLANVLIQLRRHDEARQELYRASECNLPDSATARNWAIRRGLRDVGQSVQDTDVADQARRQAIQKYLAYRRAGGENTHPGAKLCAQIGDAIRAGDTSALAARLEQTAASPNVPTAGRLLLDKLRAILAGSRDLALASDPNLHYQYAVELQLLLEGLQRPTEIQSASTGSGDLPPAINGK